MSEVKETQEPVVTPVQEVKQPSPSDIARNNQAYIKFLKGLHEKVKLEAEISEFQFRRFMADSQLQAMRSQPTGQPVEPIPTPEVERPFEVEPPVEEEPIDEDSKVD